MRWRSLPYMTAIPAAALLFGLSAPQSARAQGPQQRPNNGFQSQGTFIAGFPAVSPAFGDPAQSVATNLLKRSDVQRTLELTIRQKQALADVQTQSQQDLRQRIMLDAQNMRNLSPAERQAQQQQIMEKMRTAITGANSDMDKKVEAILTPDQAKRLHELDLQWRGPLAMADPKVADAVQLTPEQHNKIMAVVLEFRQTQNKARQDAFESIFRINRPVQSNPGNNPAPPVSAPPPPPPPVNPAQMQQRARDLQDRIRAVSLEVEKARKAQGEKVLALLTPEQQAQWQAMQGKPFIFLKDNSM